MKVCNFVIASFAVLLINVTFVGSAAAENPICAGLKGAAFGQCTAAVAVECDWSTNQPKGCVKIEENFTKLSGDSAPWVLGFCSCGELEAVSVNVQAHVDAGYPVTWATLALSDGTTIFDIDVGRGPSFHLNTKNFNLVAPKLGQALGSCSNQIQTISLTTQEEVAACWATLATVAKSTGIQKAEPTP